MKRRLLCVIVFMCVLALFGCSHNKDKDELDPIVNAYRQAATKLIEDKDYENAVQALTEGVELTGDESLAQMLAEAIQLSAEEEEPTSIPNEQPEETQKQPEEQAKTEPITEVPEEDYSDYAGVWAEEEIGWEMGGMIVDVEASAASLNVAISYTQSAPASRVAEISFDIPFDEIENKSVTLPFENDGWGNSGVLTLSFGEQIICQIDDMVLSDLAQWGMYEGEFVLFRNDTAHKLMEYTQEEYDEKYGEPEVENILNENIQQRINLFLSNFAEQRCSQYPYLNDYQMLQYAYTYSKINCPELISHGEYCNYMNKSDVDDILNRFFGETVTPSDNSMFFYSPYSSNESIAYGAGQYEFIAADGEYRGYVAVAYDMADNGDGTYEVWFDIYIIDYDSQTDYSEYYEMSITEAENDATLSLYQHGQATVRDYTRPNGKETYQLIYYNVY